MSNLSFTVTYSRNWDGGGQERDTAISCIRQVFPTNDIPVTPICVDKYPIRVIIEAKLGGTNVKVWEGDQRDLFRKYSTKRDQSMKTIIQNLQDLKEDFS